jgi:hypothetical protein
MLGTFAAEIKVRRVWYRALFNVSQMTLTFAAVAACYELVSDGNPSPLNSPRNVVALVLMGGLYYISNTALVSLVISMSAGMNLGHIWRINIRDLSWHNLTVVPIGALLALLWLSSPLSIVLLILPLAVVRESFRVSADLQRQTREALIGLADIIDLRDPSTYRHSQLVSDLSLRIAKRLGLKQEDADLIAFSARLHDLGKIGMSNDLLYKPGGFTIDEREEFRRHPGIGASMVAGFRLFGEGCDMILHHHETWDGKGYPDGLKGSEIPIGSQIIAVADAYEAMTSDRVYQPAMSCAAAAEELRDRSGTQFSSQVVGALLDIVSDPGFASVPDQAYKSRQGSQIPTTMDLDTKVIG